MEKQETKGRTLIAALFDAGTFVEMGAFVRRKGEKDAYDALLCGYGAVNGKLTFAFVQDSDRMKGAFDETGAAKLENLYAQAVRMGAPVIGVFDSAGAVVYDGAPALTAYGRFMKCVSDASGIVPQIALVRGVCAGMAAVVCSLFDLTVTVKDVSEVYVNPPFTVGKETGSTAYAAANGLSALTVADENAAVASVREIVSLLPMNNQECADTEPDDDPNRAVAEGLSGAALVSALADNGRVVTLYADYAPEMIVALCKMGGRLTGVVANDPAVNGGRLTSAGAAKASRMVSFCDSFSIPVVSLVDSAGVVATADPTLAPALAKLASAYLTASTAKVSAVVGKAYGAAFTLMGSRALGADLALAVDSEETVISVLDPETAVAFVWNDKIAAGKSRADVEAEWTETYACARAAAESGDVDDVIPARELRARLCAALYMLAGKADGIPDRKHGILPL